jgi:hypothetical protein
MSAKCKQVLLLLLAVQLCLLVLLFVLLMLWCVLLSFRS